MVYQNHFLSVSLKSKNAQSKQCSPMGPLSSLKIFTLKIGTPCINWIFFKKIPKNY